jgi:hypothetical protein
MTIPLPTPIPSNSGWQLVDKIDRSFKSTTPAGSTGLVTVTLDQLDTATRWVLTHMVASCTSTSATAMRLYFGSVAVNGFRDGTDRGNFDVADWPAGLFVPAGTQLIAQWSGASTGATAALALQADVYRLT